MDSVTVVVFPGQGSQRSGMARDFAEQFAAARAVFEEASAVLDLDVRALCEGGDPRLHLTEYTQPCILTAEIAMLAALREHFAFSPVRFGGHSLGEYTALVAAGAIPFAAALRLTRLRGRLMQGAVPVGQGGMVAVVQPGLDLDYVARVAAEAAVDVANYNSPSQVVLSGSTEGLRRASEVLEPALAPAGGRLVPLEVSAPFHSRALRVIEPEFERALEREAEGLDAARAVTVTSNYLGGFHGGTLPALIDALTHQISASVRWISNMKALAEDADKVYEVGPNRPLARFFKEMGWDVSPVLSVRHAERLFGGKG